MSRSLEYSSIKPKISIILASGSASRKMMLEEAGIEFDIHVSNTDEDKIKKDIASKPFSEQVISLAKAKAKSVSNIYPEDVSTISVCFWTSVNPSMNHQSYSSCS